MCSGVEPSGATIHRPGRARRGWRIRIVESTNSVVRPSIHFQRPKPCAKSSEANMGEGYNLSTAKKSMNSTPLLQGAFAGRNIQPNPGERAQRNYLCVWMLGSDRLGRARSGSSWSAAINEGLSAPAPPSDSPVVRARVVSGGRRKLDCDEDVKVAAGVGDVLFRLPPVTASAALVSSRSRFFSRSWPPRVAHLRIV